MLVRDLKSDFLSNIIAIRWRTKNELNNVVAVLEIGLRMKIGTNINNEWIMESWLNR